MGEDHGHHASVLQIVASVRKGRLRCWGRVDGVEGGFLGRVGEGCVRSTGNRENRDVSGATEEGSV